jgi:hypothetical protein
MYPRSYHLQKEVQDGLASIQLSLAQPEEEKSQYLIISTSQSKWLPHCSSDQTTIFDISGSTGETLWRRVETRTA